MNKHLLALFLVCLSISALTGFELINVLASPATSRNSTVEPGSMSDTCTYTVYIDSGTYFGLNCHTGINDCFSTVFITLLNCAGVNGGLIFLQSGTYSVTCSVFTPVSNTQLQGEGEGTTILAKQAGCTGVNMETIRVAQAPPYLSSITIRDLTFDDTANNGVTAGTAVVHLQGVDNIKIEDVTIKNCASGGIIIGSSGGNPPSIKHPIIRDTRIDNCSRNVNVDSLGGGGIIGGEFANIQVTEPQLGSFIDITNRAGCVWDNIFLRKTTAAVDANWGLASDFGAESEGVTNLYAENVGQYGVFYGISGAISSGNITLTNIIINGTRQNGLNFAGASTAQVSNITLSNMIVKGWNGKNVGASAYLFQNSTALATNLITEKPAIAGSNDAQFTLGSKVTVFGGIFYTGAIATSGSPILDLHGIRNFVTEAWGATSVADGGTITHGLVTTPTLVIATCSIASQMCSVTARASTTFTVAIKTDAGAAGTTQTVYWYAVYRP